MALLNERGALSHPFCLLDLDAMFKTQGSNIKTVRCEDGQPPSGILVARASCVSLVNQGHRFSDRVTYAERRKLSLANPGGTIECCSD